LSVGVLIAWSERTETRTKFPAVSVPVAEMVGVPTCAGAMRWTRVAPGTR